MASKESNSSSICSDNQLVSFLDSVKKYIAGCQVLLREKLAFLCSFLAKLNTVFLNTHMHVKQSANHAGGETYGRPFGIGEDQELPCASARRQMERSLHSLSSFLTPLARR